MTVVRKHPVGDILCVCERERERERERKKKLKSVLSQTISCFGYILQRHFLLLMNVHLLMSQNLGWAFRCTLAAVRWRRWLHWAG